MQLVSTSSSPPPLSPSPPPSAMEAQRKNLLQQSEFPITCYPLTWEMPAALRDQAFPSHDGIKRVSKGSPGNYNHKLFA